MYFYNNTVFIDFFCWVYILFYITLGYLLGTPAQLLVNTKKDD